MDSATQRDWEWARNYDDRLQLIAMKALGVSRIAPAHDDLRRAADFQFLWVANEPRRPLDIAGRVRRPWYWHRYPHDITFRCYRPSSATTEWAKILSGFGDFMVYAIAADDGQTDMVKCAAVINLALMREHVQHHGPGRRKTEHNSDGTRLLPWDLRTLAACPQCLGLVLYREGHGLALHPDFLDCQTSADFLQRLGSRYEPESCHRWLDEEQRWCGRRDGLRRYQIGPLCPDHQRKATR